jgi:hypothetical protein
MQGLGKGGVPLLFPTLWVASGEIKGVKVTLLLVGNVFRTHKIGVDVDSSRGVFTPPPGGKAHMAKKHSIQCSWPLYRLTKLRTKPKSHLGV